MSNKHEKPLQLVRLAQMLVRKRGVTSTEFQQATGSNTPSRRMSDMRERGWLIKKTKVLNKDFYRFFGVPPAKTAKP